MEKTVLSSLDYRLYLVADPHFTRGRELSFVVEEALKGGVTIVQYRDKSASDEEYRARAEELLQLTRLYQVPLILNDRVKIAIDLGVEGVHIGPEDMALPEARKYLGEKMIVGFSAGSVEEAKEAELHGADYLGIGPVFSTQSKADAGEALGVDGLAKICQSVAIPSVGIGAINSQNVRRVLASGVSGIAVISALSLADDIAAEARELLSSFRD